MKLFQHIALKLLWSGIDFLGKNLVIECQRTSPRGHSASLTGDEVVTLVIRRPVRGD
jgi:hypothetical protein